MRTIRNSSTFRIPPDQRSRENEKDLPEKRRVINDRKAQFDDLNRSPRSTAPRGLFRSQVIPW
jgi:hypothetical protein